MARLATIGFEVQKGSGGGQSNYDGDVDVSNGITAYWNGIAAFNTSIQRSGLACAEVTANTITYRFSHAMTAGRAYFFRAYFRTSDATPAALSQIITLLCNGINAVRLRINTNGTLRMADANAADIGSASAALSNDTWHRIQIKVIIPSNGNGTVEAYLDDDQFCSSANVDVNNSVATPEWWIGSPHAAGTSSYWDDVAINDDQGANQNTYPGPGKIVLLKPTSVAARGTGWVGPQTSGDDTTALETNVDNTPPLGTTHSDVDANADKYVFNIDSGGNRAFDVNLQTYTAAGIALADTIQLTQALARVASASTTGTNEGSMRSVSNPADSGDTTINMELGGVAAVEPSGWKTNRSPVQYNPNVAKGTAPVVRVTKTLANARAHMIDLMGMIVEYTADVTPPTPNLVSESLTKISAQATKDSTLVTWTTNENFQAYMFRVVPNANSTYTEGDLIEEDSSGGLGGQQYESTITDDELSAASPGDGAKIVKLFTQDLAGNWST